MAKTILITGGAGFIGSNFVLHMLEKYPEYSFINFDALTYAGNLENLAAIENNPQYTFIKGDITNRDIIKKLFIENNIDIVVHFAAESHVDRSIHDSTPFITTNVLGIQVLLDVAKDIWEGSFADRRFVNVSTDEVYGSLGETGYFTEETPLAPNSPYSASKTASDLLVRAFHETYGFPGIITRCSNNYGPYQFPEKLIPLMISNAMEEKPLPVYGDGLNVRDWLHVLDHCRAIDTVLHKGRAGQVYNIGGNNEWKNIDIVKLILKDLGKQESLISYVKDRPGHDRRYAIDAAKIKKELGWEPQYTFEQGIRETIDWYQNNRAWWERIKTGDYEKYYEQHYGNRVESRL
ncbi:MAG: dTDP-glucose 4,6-dehydratase [Candidatus Margulisiibacteriota bacterium]